jgi:hypothetical protein
MEIAKSHDTFFGDEQTQIEAMPALVIERGEKVYLPPALVYQGTADEWTTVELAQRFATDCRNAGGTLDLQLLPGERHTFRQRAPVFAQLGESGRDDESVHQEIRRAEDVVELTARLPTRGQVSGPVRASASRGTSWCGRAAQRSRKSAADIPTRRFQSDVNQPAGRGDDSSR